MKLLIFLRLTHKRFISSSPKYFKIITTISLVAGFIIGLPEFLGMFEIDVPQLIEPYYSKMISVASFVAAFIASLTVENPNDLQKIQSNEKNPSKDL